MLDFNDAQTPPPRDLGAEREAIRAELLVRLESVLFTLFPAGKKRRGRFLIGDILGSPGDSLEVVLDGDKAGLWTDRATGDGGDIYALIAAHLGIDVLSDFPRVLDAAADLLGRSRSVPLRKSRNKEVPVDELGPATAKWDYLDAEGHLIAVVYRYDPPGQKKQFRPWDAKRRKMAPPEPRPLYNQPGIQDAAQVVLVEGEKCAQALIERGIVATTAMHGANAPVIEEAAAVEDDALDALLDRALGDGLADRLGSLQVAAAHTRVEGSLERRLDARRRRQRLAAQVVDHLRVDMRHAAEHAQPRPLGRAGNPLALPQLDTAAAIVLGFDLHSRQGYWRRLMA